MRPGRTTNVLLALILAALVANVVVGVERSRSDDGLVSDVVRLVFAVAVLGHLAVAFTGVFYATDLARHRNRASARSARMGFAFGAIAVLVAAAAPLFDVPVHLVAFWLLLMLPAFGAFLHGVSRDKAVVEGHAPRETSAPLLVVPLPSETDEAADARADEPVAPPVPNRDVEPS